MRVEFQGDGTYDYDCNEPDCYFCQRMNISKQLNFVFHSSENRQHRTILVKYQQYTPRELKIIKNNFRIPTRELHKLLPNHSLNSIKAKRYQLGKKFNLTYKEPKEVKKLHIEPKDSAWLNYLNNKTA